MNTFKPFDNPSDPQNEQIKLARWLQHALAASTEDTTTPVAQMKQDPHESLFAHDYHPQFYRQLPDFIMALLANDPKATLQYAPLLYHLIGCKACHTAYLELYDALRFAVREGDEHVHVNLGTRPLATIPAITLVNLSQALIQQAAALLQQAHHNHSDEDVLARSMLQWAMRVSAQIKQSSLRERALHNLVKVALLSSGPHSPGEEEKATYAYSPLVGVSGPRHGNVVRRVDAAIRSDSDTEQAVIYIQSQPLEGTITQHENTLELHLHDLDQHLRGKHLTITVPLGSLIEPVRWLGGNPRAIRTATPVEQDGTLRTPLGETDLQLTNPDDRNLLEVMFSLLEVRPTPM